MFDPILLVFVFAFMVYAVLMYRQLRQNVKYRHLARLFFIACVIAGLTPLIVSVFERNDDATSVQSNGGGDKNTEDTQEIKDPSQNIGKNSNCQDGVKQR
jgi:hypothetical protein